jgi:hypothetical protein
MTDEAFLRQFNRLLSEVHDTNRHLRMIALSVQNVADAINTYNEGEEAQ